MMKMRIEEEVTIYSKLSLKIRDRLLNYISRVIEFSSNRVKFNEEVKGLRRYVIKIDPFKTFNKYASIDAASGVLSMNMGYVGVYGALAVLFPSLKRFFTEGSFGIFPENPNSLFDFASPHVFNLSLDIRRETTLIETAIELVRSYDLELVLLDGPLIPPFNVPSRGEWRKAYEEFESYLRKLVELINTCTSLGVNLAGFVKRPKSKLLTKHALGNMVSAIFDENAFDNVIADYVLKEKCEIFPVIDGKIRELDLTTKFGDISVKYAFIKTSRLRSPFRVDIGNTGDKTRPEDIISFILSDLTFEGIPFSILKVDEEVKMSRKLMKELYDDIVHMTAYKYGRISLINLIWGEEL